MTRSARTTRAARGFTMIELLVVILIILVLLGLVTGVGFVVIQKQKVSVTRGVLTALDRALEEYMTVNGGQAPKYVEPDYIFVPGPDVGFNDDKFFRVYPTSGGPGSATYPMRPDAAVFLRAAMGFGQVQSIVSGIGASFLRITTSPDGTTPGVPAAPWDRDKDTTPSVVDAWAEDGWKAPWNMIEPTASIPGSPRTLQQLVFYVHPENPLAQALYGKCKSGRPYFMSAGPDLFYGLPYEHERAAAHFGKTVADFASDDTKFRQGIMRLSREDNVYSYPVEWDFDVDPTLAN